MYWDHSLWTDHYLTRKERRRDRRSEEWRHDRRVPAYWRRHRLHVHCEGRAVEPVVRIGKHDAVIVKERGPSKEGEMQCDVVYSAHRKSRWTLLTDPVRFLATIDGTVSVAILDGHVGERHVWSASSAGVQSTYHRDSHGFMSERHYKRQLAAESCVKSEDVEVDIVYRIHRGSPRPRLQIGRRMEVDMKERKSGHRSLVHFDFDELCD